MAEERGKESALRRPIKADSVPHANSEPPPHSDFPLPRGWADAWPIMLWGMLALGFALVVTDSLMELIANPLARAATAFAALLGLAALLIYRGALLEKLRNPSSGLIAGVVCTLLRVLATSPFVEEKRWPFDAWFQGNSRVDTTQISTLIDWLQKAQQERDQAKQERDAARQQLAAIQPTPTAPTPKPQTNLKPADITILTDLWQSIETRDMNPLVEATNYLYVLQEQWPAKIKSDKRDFLRQIVDARKMVVDSSHKLAALRDEYPQYQEIHNTLAQSYLPPLLNAIDAFNDTIMALPDSLPSNYEVTMRATSGTLKRELDAAAAWIQTARTTARMMRKELAQ
jgi:hypothetical protein